MPLDAVYMDFLDHIASTRKGKEIAKETGHAEWRCRFVLASKAYCTSIQKKRFVVCIGKSQLLLLLLLLWIDFVVMM